MDSSATGRYLREREELPPHERFLERLEKISHTEVESVELVVSLTIQARGKVESEVAGAIHAFGGVARGRWRVNVAEGQREEPANRHCRFGRTVGASGTMSQKPYPVVNLACSPHQSADSLDGGNAPYPFNERVHALGDRRAGLVVETWTEGGRTARDSRRRAGVGMRNRRETPGPCHAEDETRQWTDLLVAPPIGWRSATRRYVRAEDSGGPRRRVLVR